MDEMEKKIQKSEQNMKFEITYLKEALKSNAIVLRSNCT